VPIMYDPKVAEIWCMCKPPKRKNNSLTAIIATMFLVPIMYDPKIH
jgi:hypothetical protein